MSSVVNWATLQVSMHTQSLTYVLPVIDGQMHRRLYVCDTDMLTGALMVK